MTVERTEDRLRQAIDARTSAVEPSVDAGMARITEKLEQADRLPARQPRPWPARTPGSQRPPWVLVAAALVLLAAVAGGLVFLRDDSGDRIDTVGQPDRPSTTPTTPTTEPSTTSTSEAQGSGIPTSVPSTSAPAEQPSGIPDDVLRSAIWPRPSSDVRFDDPVAAARSFARYLAHFGDSAVIGSFRQGDSRSGEVPVRPTANGPETTVLVRQLSDDHWYVIGSATADITVDQPESGAVLASPQPLSGQALAFEGTVQVRLVGYLPDGRSQRLASTVVTGGGGPAAPFAGSLDWQPGSAELEPVGVLLFYTVDESAESVEAAATWQVVALPVRIRS